MSTLKVNYNAKATDWYRKYQHIFNSLIREVKSTSLEGVTDTFKTEYFKNINIEQNKIATEINKVRSKDDYKNFIDNTLLFSISTIMNAISGKGEFPEGLSALLDEKVGPKLEKLSKEFNKEAKSYKLIKE